MMLAVHHGLRRQVARFLIVGSSNTVATYGLFLLLAVWLDARVAYTIAFICGLIYTAFMSSAWVFAGHRSAGRITAFVCWYLGIWAIGLAIVDAIGQGSFRRHLVAALVVICITTPANFIGGRLLLHSQPQR